MSKRALLASVLALMRPINAVWADGRTVAYLQGVAFGIAANCPNLPLDVKAISFAKKGIEGVQQGNAEDFATGAFQFHRLLNGESNGECRDAGPCTCKNVCNFRPGTCYFVKQNESPNLPSTSIAAISGRWYDADEPNGTSVCKNTPGLPESPLFIDQSKMAGHEFICKIAKTITKGPAVDVYLSCDGEGMHYQWQRTLQLVDPTHLRVTDLQNGKPQSFTVARCP